MGKQSRRNRMRSEIDTEPPMINKGAPEPGYDKDGVALPPGSDGSLFDIFKINPDPRFNGGLYQFVVLALHPYGNLLKRAEGEKDWKLYAGLMIHALGDEEYNKYMTAIMEYDRCKKEGMTDNEAVHKRVRRVAKLEAPISLLDKE